MGVSGPALVVLVRRIVMSEGPGSLVEVVLARRVVSLGRSEGSV